ncbi:MAG: hypothetical protein ACP5GL_05970 [Infirmifilum sp.]|uniref:hypothetical protein n=1 Tax=Infirmifilum sp. TaxID=2856575 RepID=UPI003D0D3828
MVKKTVIEVDGCSGVDITETLSSLKDFTQSIQIETPQGLSRVEVRVKRIERSGECWYLKIGLRKRDGWLWGEDFSVCVEEAGPLFRINIERIKGVGRVHADVFGLWIVELLKKKCAAVSPVIVSRL